MSYRHTQHGPLSWLLALVGLTAIVAALFNVQEHVLALVLCLFGVIMLGLALCFHSLTVTDEGPALAIRFGPLPLFHKRVAFDAISAVEPDRSWLIDGLGVHYVPGRGWTYNLWGTRCVRLKVKGRTLRIGSDDSENLAQAIRAKIDAADSAAT